MENKDTFLEFLDLAIIGYGEKISDGTCSQIMINGLTISLATTCQIRKTYLEHINGK